jgi:hypothetical protein
MAACQFATAGSLLNAANSAEVIGNLVVGWWAGVLGWVSGAGPGSEA